MNLKIKNKIYKDDYPLLQELEKKCLEFEPISLKLELDYKYEEVKGTDAPSENHEKNEFLYFDGDALVGYLGICQFGGVNTPFEVMGMVNPAYRQQGIFTTLYEAVYAECKRRNRKASILLLSDRNSMAGQAFIKKTQAVYHHSEFEMYLKKDEVSFYIEADSYKGTDSCKEIVFNKNPLVFRKATNQDALEVARQNAIYFDEDEEKNLEDLTEDELLLPEEEEMKGMVVYLVQLEDRIIGKVHLQLINGLGGIYGLGVLPEYRGQGFGRAILRKAIDKLKESKASDIMLQVEAENETALNLYKSCGFYETSVMDYYEIKPEV